jgi:hypothetical protein
MIDLFALLGAAFAVPAAHGGDDLRCTVALSYVTDIVRKAQGRRMVFSTDEQPPFDIMNGDWFETGADVIHPKPLPAPAPDLVERLSHTTGNAVRRCSSVRQFLRTTGITYGAQATKAARTRGVFKAYIQTVSLPVVSEDQRRAVLKRGEMRGSMDGGGWFELLERQPNGKWKVIGYRPTWMS